MSSTSVRRTVSTAEDASPGCFAGLFKLRRGGNKRTAALRKTLNPIPADDHVLDASLAELPPYVRFAHGWSGGINEQQNGQYISLGIEKPPAYDSGGLSSDVISTMEDKLKELSPALRELSLDIWNHPEIMWKEKYAHDRLTAFMASHGFTVTPHYLDIDTAFRAAYTHSSSDSKSQKNIRVIGVNSEMDALPGIGHGCGHNLIAMSGVAISLAIQAALIEHDIPGTIVLLGTPAEEEGGGKIVLLERGAYVGMDACIMSHPTSGPDNFSGIWPGVACQHIDVEFFGHGAHAGSAPWEGQNALDAAFVAYAGISALRQQIKPDQRVHGIVMGKDWAPNVIPDYAKLRYIVRAANWVELEALRDRVIACFDAAALATSCKIEVKLTAGYYELRNNDVLGRQYANVVGQRYGMTTVRTSEGAKFSTDFGNVTHALPALHPAYSIPTEPNGSNHTPQFAKAATTPEAHAATLKVALGLAATGVQVLADADFARKVKQSFEDPQAVVAAD